MPTHQHSPTVARRFQRPGETPATVLECTCGHTWLDHTPATAPQLQPASA